MVAPAQLADQRLFVGQHAHDRAAQEVGDQARIGFHQTMEVGGPQLKHLAVHQGARTGAARVVTHQQAQLTEELLLPEGLDHQVLAEIQFDLAFQDHVHALATVATLEQPLPGMKLAWTGKSGEQCDLGIGQQRMHDLGHRHPGDT